MILQNGCQFSSLVILCPAYGKPMLQYPAILGGSFVPPLYTTIGPWTLQTFTLFLALAIGLSAGIGLRRERSANPSRTAPAIDAYLAALVLGIVGARLFHVLLNFDYFGDNLNEAFNLAAGGLDWHGAVIGGVIGLYAMTRFRIRPYQTAHFVRLLDTLTFALPLIGLGSWYGCLAAGCGYGKEVDTLANYSPLATSELVDVFGIVAPRYNTQFFGMALCIVALVIIILLFWRGWLGNRRFWFVLALLSLGLFVIGFFRGDHSPITFGLRADQWLDIAFMVMSGWLFLYSRKLKAEI